LKKGHNKKLTFKVKQVGENFILEKEKIIIKKTFENKTKRSIYYYYGIKITRIKEN